jgi:uncharacterized membrane protein YbhN (UPF0104 family)
VGVAPSVLRRARDLLGVAVAVLGIVFVVRILVRDQAAARAALDGIRWGVLLPAIPVGLGAMTWIGLGWRRCLAATGSEAGVVAALRPYFHGALGKYVPGGIWPVVGRAELAQREGVPRAAAYAATLLSLAATYLAAAAVAGVAALVVLLSGGVAAPATAAAAVGALALALVGLAALHPRVLGAALGVVARLRGRPVALDLPAWTTTARLVVTLAPAWLAISGATGLVLAALGVTVPVAELVLATTLAWLVGFLAIGVPGGVGVREAVFVALLPGVSAGSLAAAAIVSRLVFVLVDLAGAGLLLLPRRSAEPGGRPV